MMHLVIYFFLIFNPCFAHVKFFFSDNTYDLEARPIRNAPGRTSDGQMSTNGPCGGAAEWGDNGFSRIKAGGKVTMKINYNGGHKSNDNKFEAIYACGKPTQNDLKKDSDDRIPFKMNYDAQTGWSGECEIMNCPEATDSTYCPAVEGNSFTSGYVMQCTIPETEAGNNCTVALVDQRDWGGCYDLYVQPREVISVDNPDAEDAGSVDSNVGVYKYDTESVIENAPMGENCCTLSHGEFTVQQADPGLLIMQMDVLGKCNDKRFTNWDALSLKKDDMGPTWRGKLKNFGPESMEQDFEVSLADGQLMITNMDPEKPNFCDGAFLRSSKLTSSSVGSMVSAFSLIFGICILFL